VTSALLLAAYAVVLAAVGPRILLRAPWTSAAPRLGIAMWQGLSVMVLGAPVVALVSLGFGVVSLCRDLAALVHLCAGRLSDAPPISPSATVVASALLVGVVGRLAWALGRTVRDQRRQRRRTVGVIDILGRQDVERGVLVLDHDAAYAFCVPGRPARVVLTSGLLDSLSPDEIEAVLLHENAHLQQHHHLALSFARVLASAFGAVAPFLRTAEREVARLVEMCADDAACRGVGTETVRAALAGLVPGRDASLVLSASACAVGDRLTRLGSVGVADGTRSERNLGATTLALMLTLPVAGLVVDLLVSGWCPPA